ncbi:MAG: hypothetical protein ACR2OZ_20595 [Verrucomicrobiales bacterium]
MSRLWTVTVALMAAAWVLVLESDVSKNEGRCAVFSPPADPLAAASEFWQNSGNDVGWPSFGERTATSLGSADNPRWREMTAADAVNARPDRDGARHGGMAPLFPAAGSPFKNGIASGTRGLFATRPAGFQLAAAGEITQGQIDQIEAGFEQWLTQLQANVVAQVFGESLPLLGNALSTAATQGAPALHHITALKDALKGCLGCAEWLANLR